MSDNQSFTGTRPVSDQHAFDQATLSAWLQLNLPGFEGPLSVEMFKGGQSNPTYKLITPGRAYVMRAKPGPVAKLLPSAHAIEREYRVMSALRGTGVPVAQMHVLCEDESVIGRAFYVMECVDGRVMWDQSLPGLDRAGRAAIYDEMNRVLAALHTVRPDEVGLDGYGKPGNYFERQIGRWSKQYVASITQPIPEMDRLMAWLPQNIPAMARDESLVSIVHGDYRLDNLIFHPTEARVLAVIDWELSTIADPLLDLAWFCNGIRDDRFPGHIPEKALYNVTAWPTRQELMTHYAAGTGRDMADFDYYLLLAMFKGGCILEYKVAQAAKGILSRETGILFDRLVRGNFAEAEKLIRLIG